jgi:hypothetical protein
MRFDLKDGTPQYVGNPWNYRGYSTTLPHVLKEGRQQIERVAALRLRVRVLVCRTPDLLV